VQDSTRVAASPRPCRHPDVLRALRRSSPRVAERVAAQLRTAIPLYAALPDAARHETTTTIAGLWTLVLDLWEQGRLARGDELAPYPLFAVRWGEAQRPLPVVLRAWRVGGAEMLEVILAVGRDRLDAADVDVVRILSDLGDRVADRLFTAFTAVEDAPEPDAVLRARLVTDLLDGRYASTPGCAGGPRRRPVATSSAAGTASSSSSPCACRREAPAPPGYPAASISTSSATPIVRVQISHTVSTTRPCSTRSRPASA